jgi:type I restriction-modification system DNA methylase subunit
MTIKVEELRKHIQAFEFRKLFINLLGWDKANNDMAIEVDSHVFQLRAIAQKRGLMVFHCPAPAGQPIPDYATRRKIEAKLRKSFHEHLIIFGDAGNTTQKWQWVRREAGKPSAGREFGFAAGQTGEALVQRLQGLAFSLEEEERLTIIDVTKRVRGSFDLERVTKRFYERFKSEHTNFLKFLKGIPDEDLQRWYVSVTLNRIMFVYFIQRKGFLDGDPNYLRSHLERSRQSLGEDHFYRDFLCRLFFEGFAQKVHSPEVRSLLGIVPYLSGSIFERHQLEERFGMAIDIPDLAFERLFAFFDEYNWHLDENPLRADNEINPDVLGFIFEKYVNQKQMGAYYTKEDITGYISRYTILPALFERARKDCRIAFEGDNSVWNILAVDPERYIYPAMLKGLDQNLPKEIEVGLGDVAQRGEWNKPTAEAYALPTEIWRETVARRQRAEELLERLTAGEVREINDLITYNLDIQQFALDVLDSSEGPELLRAFWKGLTELKVLDPTCGSGAFLFAALNILEPLYEACLERMQNFVEELDAAAVHGAKSHPEKYADFRRILTQVSLHTNRSYFIYKSIIVQNLYGVDIMEEAVEICKLRLFLKLIAQVSEVSKIEPLPDIDFNVRAGNTLVGFTNREDVRKALTSQGQQIKLLLMDEESTALQEVEEQAELADKAFQRFREMQTDEYMDSSAFANAKVDLRKRLEKLNEELNQALALQYLSAPISEKPFRNWVTSCQPFHWFVDFYGIIKRGGFDVVIGNPPYVEYSQVREDYQIKGYSTEVSGNLYAFCTERSLNLLRAKGWIGFIVQQPIVSTQRMKATRDFILLNTSHSYFSTYDDRPSKLFDGMYHARMAIFLAKKEKTNQPTALFVTKYYKWYKEQREYLFELITYVQSRSHLELGIFPKIGSFLEDEIIKILLSYKKRLGTIIAFADTNNKVYYKITGVGHWFTITCRPPRFIRNGEESSSTRESSISFKSKKQQALFFAILNSTTFYWFYQVRTNCRDFNPSDYKTFPIPESIETENFEELARQLQESLDKSSTFIVNEHAKTGHIEIEQFRPKGSKTTIDKIDLLLSTHYKFTPEMKDFILNYDLKYRLGRSNEEENEE